MTKLDEDVLQAGLELELPTITRVELIDHRRTLGAPYGRGRVDVVDRRKQQDIDVMVSFQDDGRTLKVFIKRKGDK